MNWNNGFTSRYYLTIVDAASWRDLDRYELTGGTISKTPDSLMESADLDMVRIPADVEAWVRIYLDARQTGAGSHEAVFTGLLSAPSTDWDGNRGSHKVECYSVLKPAADVLLPRGWYAPAGMNGAAQAAQLLRIGAAPVEYEENAPGLSSSIVAEDGESNLTMARKIVDAIGWRIRIEGSGRIAIMPKSEEPVASFDSLENDCVELSITDQRDWFSCPNVFRAVNNDMVAVARDDDPERALSTVSRGREIWKEEQSCILNDGESLEEYAVRRLKEEQRPSRVANYQRRFHPDVVPGDAVRLHFAAQAIDGAFRVRSQRIELGYGARTEEESEQI